MASVTTRAQQAKIGAAARKVGGYRTLINLAAQKQAGGETAKIARDARTGKWVVIDEPLGKKKFSYKFELSGRSKTQRK